MLTKATQPTNYYLLTAPKCAKLKITTDESPIVTEMIPSELGTSLGPHNHMFGHFFISEARFLKANDAAMSKWRHQPLFFDLNLYFDSRLDVAVARSEELEVYLLGTALDAQNPAAGQLAVAEMLLSADNISEFEKRLDFLAGRWVVIRREAESAHLYHDATGLRTVYLFDDNERRVVASQPSVLREILGICSDANVVKRYRESGADFMPPDILPTPNTRQLFPNHKIDLKSFQITRYWPRHALIETSLDTAASEIKQLLQAIIEAAIQRKGAVMSLSGGFDSRALTPKGRQAVVIG